MKTMDIYCVKCKKATATNDIKPAKTSKGQPMVVGTCANCGIKKTQFVSKDKIKEGGFLGPLFKLFGLG